jgi:acyl transferase domain-containing protein/thioesterase domain-containing protein
MLVLKRLADAIHDGDCIHAVIKGSAVNNDGSEKVGFTAPSIQGQAAVIREALAVADVSPDSIGYVEAHGTGTSLGDPIEIAGLTEAFRGWTDRKAYCPIGSVKTNIGHLDAGAGVAGVIKAVLALRHERIPPSLNFRTPNPQIDFDNSPFYVNTELSAWPENDGPRRAGVSSFGLGGTNAHVILEEAPETEPPGPSRSRQLLLVSAKSEVALSQATRSLAEHLRRHPDMNLADAAYTLQTGRRAFDHRRVAVCQDLNDALAILDPVDLRRVATSTLELSERDVVFMFSGQGSQHPNMGLELYESEPQFRQQVDKCSEILRAHLSLDLRHVLYPGEEKSETVARMLRQTSLTQPALFVIEYALATLLIHWGVHPQAMVGHSIGEYVAACLAGVLSLEDALSLVSTRGRLMQELPSGSMLAVPLTERQIQSYVNEEISPAVINGPSLCVVSGEPEAIRQLERQLAENGVDSRILHTSHAFHSNMMEPILEPFTEEVRNIELRAPEIPFVSNVTGTWITRDEATDPSYWARHLRQTVRFSDCLQELFQEPNRVLVEVGPGRTLATFARQHPDKPKRLTVLSSTRHPKEDRSDLEAILDTLGRLWLAGVQVDWSRFYEYEVRHRVSLPTYPFERKRYWIDPGNQAQAAARSELDSTVEPETNLANGGRQEEGSSGTHEGAPRSNAESSLAGIWQVLLGVDDLTIHDNFFDVGGSSLLASRLFTQIETVFGQRLPLAAIFQAPTIEQLAAILDQRVSLATESSLVRIQEGQSRPPLFCLPGNLGNVFNDLRYLSRHLGHDQPVYGIQDGIGHPSDVEALAAHYVQDIRKVQPKGPYFVVGICSGGAVAFEMVQQLRHEGQRAALLALVEPAALPLPGANSYSDLATEIWGRLTRRLGDHTGNATQLGWAERVMYVRLRLKVVANIWALKRYCPQSYPGRFHLFLTRESLADSPRLGWTELATGGAKVHEIPGTHRSITGDYARIEEAHMQVLGEQLRACMDSALMDDHGS